MFLDCLCSFHLSFPHSSVGKESACNVGDPGSIPGSGRSPGEGKGYPLQYSGLENSMDCMFHGLTKSWARLSNFLPYIPFDLISWRWGPSLVLFIHVALGLSLNLVHSRCSVNYWVNGFIHWYSSCLPNQDTYKSQLGNLDKIVGFLDPPLDHQVQNIWLVRGQTTREFGNVLPGLPMDRTPRILCFILVFNESQWTKRDPIKHYYKLYCVRIERMAHSWECKSWFPSAHKQNASQIDAVQFELIMLNNLECLFFFSILMTTGQSQYTVRQTSKSIHVLLLVLSHFWHIPPPLCPLAKFIV